MKWSNRKRSSEDSMPSISAGNSGRRVSALDATDSVGNQLPKMNVPGILTISLFLAAPPYCPLGIALAHDRVLDAIHA